LILLGAYVFLVVRRAANSPAEMAERTPLFDAIWGKAPHTFFAKRQSKTQTVGLRGLRARALIYLGGRTRYFTYVPTTMTLLPASDPRERLVIAAESDGPRRL